MKNLLSITFIVLVAMIGWHCGNTTPNTAISNNDAAATKVANKANSSSSTSSNATGDYVVKGKINGASSMRVFLDDFQFNNLVRTVASTSADSKGNFELKFDNLKKGLYRIRIGAKKAYLAFAGDEQTIEINGNLETLNKYDFEVKGSGDALTYVNTRRNLLDKGLDKSAKQSAIMSVNNPIGAAHLAMSFIPANEGNLQVHKTIKEKVAKLADDSAKAYAKDYNAYISQREQAIMAKKAAGRIAVGQPAPDIKLPDPNGKEFALSDLKGKVVLLDFWASWCGPCRKANPTVVKAYNKFNKDGFEVFSVSLDGLDTRTKRRFGGDQQKIAAQLESSKNRWVQAIEKDGLKWRYHVSDLKKWESFPASAYAVRSIPRTFLIDRKGNIAFVDLHPLRHDLEGEIKKLL